ncbi:MAG: YaaL family protein [Thermovenabulum sp.]|uniref:YaaL family protein n=1 Tax=Thermovenabulum sp. TaxID=3100335 RepID=UPI003C7E247D
MKGENKNNVLSWLSALFFEEVEEENVKDDLVEELKRAKNEWIAAEKYFESVSDPDLVEYAIYNIEAAKRKYIYLLKKAREEGITSGYVK